MPDENKLANIEPETREETFLQDIADGTQTLTPAVRKEEFLRRIAAREVLPTPEEPGSANILWWFSNLDKWGAVPFSELIPNYRLPDEIVNDIAYAALVLLTDLEEDATLQRTSRGTNEYILSTEESEKFHNFLENARSSVSSVITFYVGETLYSLPVVVPPFSAMNIASCVIPAIVGDTSPYIEIRLTLILRLVESQEYDSIEPRLIFERINTAYPTT